MRLATNPPGCVLHGSQLAPPREWAPLRAIHPEREPGRLEADAASPGPPLKQPVHVGRVAPDPSPGVVYVGQRFLFLVHEGALQNGTRSP